MRYSGCAVHLLVKMAHTGRLVLLTGQSSRPGQSSPMRAALGPTNLFLTDHH
jgi:hypothetical protein